MGQYKKTSKPKVKFLCNCLKFHEKSNFLRKKSVMLILVLVLKDSLMAGSPYPPCGEDQTGEWTRGFPAYLGGPRPISRVLERMVHGGPLHILSSGRTTRGLADQGPIRLPTLRIDDRRPSGPPAEDNRHATRT